MNRSNATVRFVPSRVEGLPSVSDVAVFPDRMELLSDGHQVVVRFADIARWPRPRWLRRLVARYGLWPRWLPVADRDWFHKPADRYFRFYSDPPVVLYMPVDEPDERGPTCFRRLQFVLAVGGFHTFDLG